MKLQLIVSLIVITIIFTTMSVATSGPHIIVKDLGHDQNGYNIRGQTVICSSGNSTIIIDDNEINKPNIDGVLLHEIGHVISHGTWTEKQCDDFAARNGHPLNDDPYY